MVLMAGLAVGSPVVAQDQAGASTAGASPTGVWDQSRQDAIWRDVNDFVDNAKVSGFAGGRYEPDGRTVRIFWAGDPPAALHQLAARHAETQAAMTIHPVALDRRQFVAAAREVVAQARQAGIPVVSAGRTPDFAGMRVRLEGTATTVQKETLRALGATEIVENEGAHVPLIGRYDDTPHFYGGSVITARAGICSTGWVVRRADNTSAMVTAQHCGENAAWFTWGSPAGGSGNSNGLYVGQSGTGHALTDSVLISGVRYYPATYVGPWNSTSGRDINEAREPAYWSEFCAEGALSGEVCSVRVEEIDAVGPDGAGPGFYGRSVDGVTAVAGRGDSGSPAIAYNNGRVVLGGMVQAASGGHPADCAKDGGNPWYAWKDPSSGSYRTCFSRVFFVNQSAIHAALNVEPRLLP
ncbi:hypothetical protein GCM10022225_25500 [Plantactinospora mayteni]